jgi:hypothetical protein
MNKEDIVKLIDGNIFYRYDYADFLYKQLEFKDLILKALHKYFTEHEEYENDEFLRQLESCTKNDMEWLKRMAGVNNER